MRNYFYLKRAECAVDMNLDDYKFVVGKHIVTVLDCCVDLS